MSVDAGFVPSGNDSMPFTTGNDLLLTCTDMPWMGARERVIDRTTPIAESYFDATGGALGVELCG